MPNAKTQQILLGARFLIIALLTMVHVQPAWSKLERPTNPSNTHVLACKAFSTTNRTDPSFFAAKGRRIVLVPRDAASLRNQCMGTCTLNATGTFLEYAMAATLGQYVRLSLEYLMSEVLAEEYIGARSIANYSNPHSQIEDRVLNNVVAEFGLLPESSWKPRLDITTNAGHLRQVRNALDQLLKDEQKEKGLKPAMSFDWMYERRVRALIRRLVGTPPEQFKWNGELTNPKEFAERYLGLNLSSDLKTVGVARMRSAGQRRNKWTRALRPFDPSSLRPMIEQLTNGQPILGSLKLEKRFVDTTTGLISTNFVRPNSLVSEEFHKVVWVGYELDSNGEFVGLFFQNSWGESGGPIGLFEVHMDYLKKHYEYLEFDMRPEWRSR